MLSAIPKSFRVIGLGVCLILSAGTPLKAENPNTFSGMYQFWIQKPGRLWHIQINSTIRGDRLVTRI